MTPLKTPLALLLLTRLAAGLGEFYERVEFDGSCPAIKAMDEIILKRFMRVWFVFKMYSGKPLLKCISEEYSNLIPGIFNITRQGLQSQDNRTVEERALAIPVSPRRKNRIRASFHISTAGLVVGAVSHFDVLSTDYEDYAIVGRCIPSLTHGKHLQSLVLFSRKRLPEGWVKQKMHRLLREFGLSLTKLKKIDQRSC